MLSINVHINASLFHIISDCSVVFHLTCISLMGSAFQESNTSGNDNIPESSTAPTSTTEEMEEMREKTTAIYNYSTTIAPSMSDEIVTTSQQCVHNHTVNNQHTINTDSNHSVTSQDMNSTGNRICQNQNNTTYITLFLGVTIDSTCSHYECSSNFDTCNCDQECLLYGDCCFDYLNRLYNGMLQENKTLKNQLDKLKTFESLVKEDRFSKELFILSQSLCIWDERKINAFWMVSKCPEYYVDKITKQKCENSTVYGLNSIPIEWTDDENRIWLFKNIFCAFCHGHELNAKLVKWKVEVACSDKNENILTGDINLLDPGSDCEVAVKSGREGYLRTCKTIQSVESQCQQTLEPSMYKLFCNSYVYMVKQDVTLYRNPHCAICDAEIANYQVYCPPNFVIIEREPKRAIDLQVLFDFNLDQGFTAQVSCVPNTECLYVEVFDCISGRCRQLYCSENQTPYFGECISSPSATVTDNWYEALLPHDINAVSINVLYLQIDAVTTLPLPADKVIHAFIGGLASIDKIVDMIADIQLSFGESDEADNKMQHGDEKLVDSWDTDEQREVPNNPRGSLTRNTYQPNNLTNGAYTETTRPIVEKLERSNRQPVGGINPMDEPEDEAPPTAETPRDDPTTKNIYCSYYATLYLKTRATKETINFFKHVMKTSDNVIPNYTKVNITARTYANLRSLQCDEGNMTIEFNASVLENTTEISFPSKQHTAAPTNVLWEMSSRFEKQDQLDTIVTCLIYHQVPKMDCNMTAYDKHELYFVNSTAHVKNSSVSYSQTDYVMIGNKVFVCVDKLRQVTYIRFFRYSGVERVLTLFSSSLSLVCLLAICIMHLIFPKLRNNHGLNTFSLATSLALVHTMLLIQTAPDGVTCVVFAVCLHYLILNMFAWMSIIGLDMAMTFYSKTLSNNSKNIGRFLKNFSIVVILPLVAVVACFSLDAFEAGLRPGYGTDGICWLTTSSGIIYLFIVPVCTLITLNLVTFTITLISIQTTKVNSSVRTTARNRTYLLVYFKLSLILGFTWIIGISAALVSMEWLWYLHIVLNGCQGLSLFLCTMVNARTVRVFKESSQTLSFADTKSSKISCET